MPSRAEQVRVWRVENGFYIDVDIAGDRTRTWVARDESEMVRLVIGLLKVKKCPHPHPSLPKKTKKT